MNASSMHSGMFVFPAIERIVYGQAAAQTLRAEAERLGASRIFLIVSGTMNRTTDEIAKVRDALGNRYAGVYDRMPPHTPRGAVLEAACAARAVSADLLVTFGGGSVIDAGRIVQIALRHDITDIDGFEPFRTVVQPDGSSVVPDFGAPTVRQIAIPTTLSGAEFAASGGCKDERIALKQSYRHRLLVSCFGNK